MTKKEAIDKALGIASAETGYLEKASNSSLDSKTANAGSNNYTKYWRDVYPAFQGQAWCACFVSWVLMRAFGQADAAKMLKHWPYVYCPTLANMTGSTTPHRGDIVIFKRNGTFAHTGLVESVNGAVIATVEGNTSGASGIIANGGGVRRKTYHISTLPGTKYFTPDWGLVSKEAPARKKNKDGTYTVTRGDTLPAIGRDFNCSISNLQKWNGLKSDAIKTGLRLRFCYYKIRVTQNRTPVKAGAGKAQKTIALLPTGTILEAIGSTKSAAGNKWYKVRYQDMTRYVYSDRVERV